MTILEKRENEQKEGGLGVFEETAPLRKVLMWGAPGAETVLGQLLPKKLSCFEAQFDVLEARKEFEGAKQILESEGVEVVLVKDLFAKMIEDKNLSPETNLETLQKRIEGRAYEYYKRYRGQDISDVEEVLGWLDEVLGTDVRKYGEKTAVLINETLSLSNELPLSNVLYARDQSNLLGGTWVWSSMKHQIRQPEVHLFKTILNHSGILDVGDIEQIQVRDGGRFEGGDGIANNGVFYVGVGGRTNLEGVKQIARVILDKGGRLMVPIDAERDLGLKNEMDAMHLDTIWMPSGKNEIVACGDEVERRNLLEVVKNKTGRLEIKERGNLADHLVKRDVDLVPLTKYEQERYAPNFLNLGNNVIVLSLAEGNKLAEELGKRGKRVYNANLLNITKGYGGLHCMTASIKRG